jgi:two-component system LytT family sensor kinase
MAGSAAVFTGIGLFRGLVQAALTHAAPLVGLATIASAVAGTLVWVPVTLILGTAWRRRWSGGGMALFHVTCGSAMLLLEPMILSATRTPLGTGYGPLGKLVVWRLDTNIIFYVAVAAATWAVERARRHAASQLAAADLERALANAQLQVLTLQLHPHFLFNTLNLISQLAYESVAEALRTLSNLRGLLVQSLAHAGRREVSLDEEIGFLDAYLEIQQTRFRERLDAVVRVDPNAFGAAIPHLLLQPLVENAIVHAVAPRAARGRIDISVCRRATGIGDRLVIRIVDDGPGVVLPVREGLGLGNTRLRLEQLFGGDYRLTVGRNDTSGTAATVDIPFRLASTVQPPAQMTDDEESVPSTSRSHGSRGRANSIVLVSAAWLGIGAIWTELESVAGNTPSGPFVFTSSAMSSAINVALWIALTPLVVWLARRIDLSRRATVRAFSAHLGLGVVVAFTHLLGWLFILYFVTHTEFHRHLNQSFDWLL